MEKFAYSRFYKWTRVILWVAAVIVIGLSQTLGLAVVCLAVALGYTVVPLLIMTTRDTVSDFSREHPSRSEIEELKSSDPEVVYLNTLFDDISHINAISGHYGIDYIFAVIKLGDYPFLHLYLTPDEDRIDFIQWYKDAISSWYRGEGGKRPEELQREFAKNFRYEGDGYTAKNASFRRELEEDSLSEMNSDQLGWYLDLCGLAATSGGRSRAGKAAVTAITECAEAHGYHVKCRRVRENYRDEYTLHVSLL